MVDSRNIGTSSLVTRRNLLSVAAASLTAPAATPTYSTPVSGLDGEGRIDPAVSLWREWNKAHKCRYKLCRQQQKLETKLLRMVGRFPQVELQIPGKAIPVFASTAKEIDRLLPGTEMNESRKQAKAELLARNNAWKAADAQIGYTLAYKAETEMVGAEVTLVEALWSTPAQSIHGVTAKLHSVIETHDPGASLGETPWPELRLILADLLRINANTSTI
ncbi:hypothetical protein ACC734_36200 [Rhizobium ruizarguesonis]